MSIRLAGCCCLQSAHALGIHQGASALRTMGGVRSASSLLRPSLERREDGLEGKLEGPSAAFDYLSFPPRKTNTLLNICPQGFEDVVTRFGKYRQSRTSGMYFAIPFIDEIHRVDMREMTLEVHPATGITQDNVSVKTGGALYVQAILVHAISVMRSRIGTVELDMLFHERNKLNKELVEAVSEAANKWGLTVLRYELTDVIPDDQVAKAMDSQATAERRRRETILNADAERQRMERESLGKRQAYINEAEGWRQKVILEAEAEKMKRVLEANGQAEALQVVAKAIETPEGRDAMNFLMAQAYCTSITSGLGESSTVFMQKDLGDVASIVAQGMGVLQAVNKGTSQHLSSRPASPSPPPPSFPPPSST